MTLARKPAEWLVVELEELLPSRGDTSPAQRAETLNPRERAEALYLCRGTDQLERDLSMLTPDAYAKVDALRKLSRDELERLAGPAKLVELARRVRGLVAASAALGVNLANYTKAKRDGTPLPEWAQPLTEAELQTCLLLRDVAHLVEGRPSLSDEERRELADDLRALPGPEPAKTPEQLDEKAAWVERRGHEPEGDWALPFGHDLRERAARARAVNAPAKVVIVARARESAPTSTTSSAGGDSGGTDPPRAGGGDGEDADEEDDEHDRVIAPAGAASARSGSAR